MARLLRFSLFAITVCSALQTISAQERPTLNVTCDPRPDILPSEWFNHPNEYRRVYNRPRYLTGKIAHAIAPTSQEAMVWCENYRAGVYSVKNAPPRYKRYFAPKPWEVLQTGARPDFPKSQQPTAPLLDEVYERDVDAESVDLPTETDEPNRITGESVPAPISDASPSDSL